MSLMGDFAAANHEIIHARVARHLSAEVLAGVENHHNFAWRERHGDRDVVVHRKGATPAGVGVLGVIPGSMATPGFVVRGRGSAASLESASHGAGRVMSRTAARAAASRWKQVQPLLDQARRAAAVGRASTRTRSSTRTSTRSSRRRPTSSTSSRASARASCAWPTRARSRRIDAVTGDALPRRRHGAAHGPAVVGIRAGGPAPLAGRRHQRHSASRSASTSSDARWSRSSPATSGTTRSPKSPGGNRRSSPSPCCCAGLHDATAGFEPPADACWMLEMPGDLPAEVVCHNDFAPTTSSSANGGPVGVIDWETAAPGARVWDVAYAAYRWVPLSRSAPAELLECAARRGGCGCSATPTGWAPPTGDPARDRRPACRSAARSDRGGGRARQPGLRRAPRRRPRGGIRRGSRVPARLGGPRSPNRSDGGRWRRGSYDCPAWRQRPTRSAPAGHDTRVVLRPRLRLHADGADDGALRGTRTGAACCGWS